MSGKQSVTRPSRTHGRAHVVPKLVGNDHEFGNYFQGAGLDDAASCCAAARAVLAEVDGIASSTPSAGAWGCDPQDWGRKYLGANGSCFYLDLGHFEAATAETLSAREHVAAWQANLRIARQALTRANAALPPGQRIVLLANNSDGHGAAYGTHLSVLMSRAGWDDIFHDRLFPALFVLASYQVSSIVYTGQGKVGAENGRPPVDYQLTQRGDFFDCLVAERTTFRRPLVNARDEPLCGGIAGADGRYARLHVIFYDANLAEVATFLKVGVLQIVAAMCEARCVDPRLILEAPLEALLRWGHDPDLQARARLATGEDLTAVELQLRFAESARAFVEAGGCDGAVPEAPAILDLWEDTLEKLHMRDLDALAPRLDWVMKRRMLEHQIASDRQLTWDAEEVKALDLLYSAVDEDEGVYWQLARGGCMAHVADDAAVTRLEHAPPEDTRAWGRAALLRLAGPARVSSVDWDSISFRDDPPGGATTTVRLPDPLAHTRAEVEPLLRAAPSLDALLELLRVRGAGDDGYTAGWPFRPRLDGSPSGAATRHGGAEHHWSDDDDERN